MEVINSTYSYFSNLFTGPNLFAELPDEIVLHIFTFLDPFSQWEAKQVCRQWKIVLDSPEFSKMTAKIRQQYEEKIIENLDWATEEIRLQISENLKDSKGNFYHTPEGCEYNMYTSIYMAPWGEITEVSKAKKYKFVWHGWLKKGEAVADLLIKVASEGNSNSDTSKASGIYPPKFEKLSKLNKIQYNTLLQFRNKIRQQIASEAHYIYYKGKFINTNDWLVGNLGSFKKNKTFLEMLPLPGLCLNN